MGAQHAVVLVTGSSGLIGSAVVRRLASSFRVIGFDREGDPHPPKEAECVCVDVTSDQSVRDALSRVRYAYGHRIASVIHLAAYYDFSGEPSPKYEAVTVRGTERLFRALREFEVEQFVFSSTMLVHAPSKPGERIREDSPLAPAWDYPRSKVRTEELLRAQRGGLPVVLLRIAGVYDDRCHSIPIAHQIQRIYERQLLGRVYPGDTSHGRQSFVHLDDLVDAVERAVASRTQLPPELTLLIGEPDAPSYEELQEDLGCLIHGEEWKTREIPESVAKAGAWLQDTLPVGAEPFIKPWMIALADDDYELDITRARDTLAWEPRRSLRETLPRMVAALEADPLGWYRENHLEPPPWLAESAARKREKPASEAPASARSTARPEHTERSAAPGAAGSGKVHAIGHREGRARGADPLERVRESREKWLWTNYAIAALGVWLATSPITFGYAEPPLLWSDVASGALLALASLAALWPRFDFWGRWTACFVGIWLQFAPLVFWAPNAAAYLNDTLVGTLAIGLTVLVPMMPGMAHHMAMSKPGPEIPPGWSYNPSSWHQRAPIIALGFAGWFISRYLAAVQLGYIASPWEPFFGEGTLRVLHSDVSRAWPISDAGFGAAAYTFEALMGFMGARTRWRTMPWMVTFFGILVVPLGVTHVVLVTLQPVVVGHWCTLCLAAAAVMLVMIPLTLDEVVAMVQFLVLARREGKPLWRTFWVGDTLRGGAMDERTPRYGAPIRDALPAAVWGVNVPPTLLASSVLGLWLMASPSILGLDTRSAAADAFHLTGALVVTTAVIAMAEVGRPFRFANVVLGLVAAAAPWLLAGATSAAAWSGVLAGAAILALSIPRGRVRETYGAWDRYIV